MKCPIASIALVLGCLAVASAAEPSRRNQFLPDQPWPDNHGVHINAHGGGFLEHNGTWYWFGEHKIAGRRGNQAQVGVHCYSSPDLYNWTDEGIALAVSEDPDSEITRGCILERPKVVYNRKTRQFVMWFHLEFRGTGYRTARTAVAVSDQITGPYRYLRSYRPNAGQWPINMTLQQIQKDPDCEILRRDFQQGQMARDMTVFVDDDGTAYHIHASEENQTLHISRLTDDYLAFTDRYIRVFPKAYNEAPAVVKRQGKYYLVSSGCTGWAPNAARSAVADTMLGTWKALGNPCRGVNPHNNLGPNKTFGGQSTFIIPVGPDRSIAVFDVWTPQNPIDGRYLFLPLDIQNGKPVIQWHTSWQLDPRHRP